MNRILGNAVFLWPINPVRLLTYKLAANPRAITGADGAIAQVALAQGRQVQRTDLVDGDVATQLAAADVFLIYGQELASDTTLNQLGQDWASAMSAFVNRGGTVIVLDGLYRRHSSDHFSGRAVRYSTKGVGNQRRVHCGRTRRCAGERAAQELPLRAE